MSAPTQHNPFQRNGNSSGNSNGGGSDNADDQKHHRYNNQFDIQNFYRNHQHSTYSHHPNTVPPYVLDAISKNLPENIDPAKREDDTYLESIQHSWYMFMQNVKVATTYPQNKISYGTEHIDRYDLESPWNGEDRLKEIYLNDARYHGEKVKRKGFFSMFQGTKDAGEHDTKIKRSAGYWMKTENRSQLKPTLKKVFMFNPLVPLMLRIITLIFCVAALALACSIFIFSKSQYNGHSVDQQASTIMAIVVQSCALVYVIYIAYDEYAGKPLGLREPMSKLGLVLLDLLFIIFSSANLSLAFNTLFDDQWVCEIYRNPDGTENVEGLFPIVSSICRRQRALASFLFVVLVTWVLTFTISLLRVIDRVNAPKKSVLYA